MAGIAGWLLVGGLFVWIGAVLWTADFSKGYRLVACH